MPIDPKQEAFDGILTCFMFAFMDFYKIYDYDANSAPYKEFLAIWTKFNELERYYRRNKIIYGAPF